MFKLNSLVLLSLLVSGCVPITGTYYRPYSEGAIERRAICRDGSGPVTRVSIESGTGLLTFSASKLEEQPGFTNFRLYFEPDWVWEKTGTFTVHLLRKAERSTLSIKPNEVEVLFSDSSTIIRPKLTYLSSKQESQLPITPVLELNAFSPSIAFWLDYELDLGNQKEFTVVIPDYFVDGIQFKSRRIHFIEKWDIWIEPLNGC